MHAETSADCCQHCVDAAPACGFAAWNGPEFKQCYLKATGCSTQPSAGTTGSTSH